MASKPFEFEKALRELEEITAWFESSDVDLDQGLAKFERGMELSTQLKEHLAGVENRVEKIKQRFAAPAAPSHPAVRDDGDDQSDLFA
jgi:exodeoxyribonuclease VII small subunit